MSESRSESSERANGSLQRQMSSDSAKSLRQRSVSLDDSKKGVMAGEKLIEIEKAETGSVKWDVYKHYLKSIGIFLSLATILLNMVFQGKDAGKVLTVVVNFQSRFQYWFKYLAE